MKSLIIFIGIVAVTVLVTACGDLERSITSVSGHSERCYKGVAYVNFTTGASPVYRIGPNGEPLLTAC